LALAMNGQATDANTSKAKPPINHIQTFRFFMF